MLEFLIICRGEGTVQGYEVKHPQLSRLILIMIRS